MAGLIARSLFLLLPLTILNTTLNWPAATALAMQRPADPWVYTSSIDDRSRALIVALHRDMWLAYDTRNGDIYKAWPGGGGEPLNGISSFTNDSPVLDGPFFLDNSDNVPWRIIRNGVETVPELRYRGYRLFGEQLTVMYTAITEYGHEIAIEESPEVVHRTDGRPGLQRVFFVEGLPSGFQLALEVEFRTLKQKDDVVTDGTLQRSGGRSASYAWGNTFDVLGRLILQDGRTTTLTTYFVPSILENLHDASQFEPLDFFSNGLSLQTLPKGVEDGKPNRLVRRSDHEPGVAVKIFGIGESIEKLAPLAPGQLPSAYKVAPAIDLRDKEAFGGLDFYFITQISGYLNIASAGDYTFKVEADDGIRLAIADSVLIEHDGLQAANSSQEASISLLPGVHPLSVDHFQSTGQKQLTLYWKPPWQDHFEVVQEPVISTPREEQRRTSPGKKRMLRMPASNGLDVDRIEVTDRHPALDIESIALERTEGLIGGLDALSNGDLVAAVWKEGRGRVVVVENFREKTRPLRVRDFAGGLEFPLGVKVVDDEVFVLQKQELTHLIDNDADGVADEYHTVANNWPITTDYQELAFGLGFSKGSFYAGLGIPIESEGAILIEELPERGEIVRIGFDGSVTPVLRGLHIPNGITVDEDGTVIVADHRNPWFSDSRLLYWESESNGVSEPEEASLADPLQMSSIWLPATEEFSAPTQPIEVTEGPYEGQWIVGDLNGARLNRFFLDRVNGRPQGVVFLFSNDTPFPINRIAQLDDGSIVAGGMPFNDTWTQPVDSLATLSRLSFTERSAFEMHSVRATTTGFEVAFTQPLDTDSIDLADLFRLFSWPNSETTRRRARNLITIEELEVQSVEIEEDGKTVQIEAADLKPSTIVYLQLNPDVRSSNGTALWTNEAWYSLNEIPGAAVGMKN